VHTRHYLRGSQINVNEPNDGGAVNGQVAQSAAIDWRISIGI